MNARQITAQIACEYVLNHDASSPAVAASTGTSEDVEARLRHHLRATTGGLGVADLDALLAARAGDGFDNRDRRAVLAESIEAGVGEFWVDGVAEAIQLAAIEADR